MCVRIVQLGEWSVKGEVRLCSWFGIAIVRRVLRDVIVVGCPGRWYMLHC